MPSKPNNRWMNSFGFGFVHPIDFKVRRDAPRGLDLQAAATGAILGFCVGMGFIKRPQLQRERINKKR